MDKKQISSVIIIVFLVTTGLIGITGFTDIISINVEGTSLYVGGAGGGNYTKIQYAIENASSGDTIYVYDGDYYEMLVINKGISIVGNGSQTTRVYNDAGGYLIEVSADGVNITGLTIDGMNMMSYGLYLNNVNDFHIFGSSIVRNDRGVEVSQSDFNTIENNEISNNGYYGIHLYYSNNTTLENNTCVNNEYNIMIEYSNDTLVQDNNCSGGMYGFRVEHSGNNIIRDNYLKNTVQFYTSINNTLHNNTITGSDVRFYSGYNFVTNNTIKDSWGNGLYLAADSVAIENNTISNCTSGITLSSSNGHIVKNNTLYSMRNYGIQVSNSDSNEFYDNDLIGCGFYLWGDRDTYTTQDISVGNTVNTRPVAYYKNIHMNNMSVLTDFPAGVGQVIGGNVSWLRLENLNVSGQTAGILLAYSSNNYAANNNCSFNQQNGIRLTYSSNNYLYNNSCEGVRSWSIYNEYSDNNIYLNNSCDQTEIGGIIISNSKDCTLINNSIKIIGNYLRGIYLGSSTDCKLYSNEMEHGGIYITGTFSEFTTQDITMNNTINGKPVYYYKNTDMGNASVPANAGGIIIGNVSNLKIEDQNLSDATAGILGGFSENIYIANNTLSRNYEEGLYLIDTNNLWVINNEVTGNGDYGMQFAGTCNDILLQENVVTDQGQYDIGIEISDSSGSIITDNICTGNDKGITFVGQKSIISYNDCSDNREGMEVQGEGNIIEYNILNGNENDGLVYYTALDAVIRNNTANNNLGDGIYVDTCDNAIIENNYCVNNKGNGMEIQNGANSTISDNTCNYNNLSGMYLSDLLGHSRVENNTVYASTYDGLILNSLDNCHVIFNTISSNGMFGMNFTSSSSPSKIHHNNFFDNNGGGIQASDADNQNIWDNGADAGNFWNDYTKRYPAAKIGSPFWDIPYVLSGSGGRQDNYPLVYATFFTYTPRSVIRINNDTDFTNASGVVRGSGIEADPYIISGWEINGTSEGNCIYIGNTTGHFVVENCLVRDASGMLSIKYYLNTGILLHNVTNGTVVDVVCQNNYHNIYLARSGNCTVLNATSSAASYGIYLDSSNNSTVSNCKILDNAEAIFNWNSTEIQIRNNSITNSGGIQVYSSVNCTLKNNTISGTGARMDILNSQNITLTGNLIDGVLNAISIKASRGAELYSNTMAFGGIYLELNESESISLTIETNNTVNGNPVYYYKNADLLAGSVPPGAGQVICAKVTNFYIENQVLSDLPAGITILYSSNINIRQNTCSQSTYGIRVEDSGSLVIDHNTLISNTNSGVAIFGTSPDSEITYNNCSNNNIGIEVYSNYLLISNNNCNDNTMHGIYTSNTDYNTIFANDCQFNQYGIGIKDSGNFNTLANNSCLGNLMGLWLSSTAQSQRDNVFESNNFSQNQQHGIYLNLQEPSGSRDNIFSNNTCYMNGMNGIKLEGSYRNTFEYNYLEYNFDYGILAGSGAKYNMIHHNSFIENSQIITDNIQAYDASGKNQWNVTGEGNYWSNYQILYPTATNNGRWWDMPYILDGTPKSRDYHPLVYRIEYERPGIQDLSLDTAGTGNQYTIRCVITDNLKVNKGYVEYWFGNDTGNSTNATLEYNSISDIWTRTITIPSNKLEPMRYILSAVDVNFNWAGLSLRTVSVIDDDAPVPVVSTDKITYLEGDTVHFNSTGSSDNIGIVNYSWKFVYGGADRVFYNGKLAFKFNIPGNYLVTFTAADAAGNEGSKQIWANITMIEKPRFSGLSYPETVEIDSPIQVTVSITDKNGGGINTVHINYTDVGGNNINTSMTKVVGDVWSYSIPGQDSAGTVKFTVWATNVFGKWNRTSQHIIIILDSEPPVIKNVNYPASVEVDDPITITADVTDNDVILEVRLIFTDVSQIVHNVTMTASGGSSYGYVIKGQSKAGIFNFIVYAADANGNNNHTVTYKINILKKVIKDLIPPRVVSTQPPTNSTNVSITTVVVIIFNESMNVSTVINAIKISPDIGFDLNWTSQSVLRIKFKENLTLNTTYEIEIGRNLTDLAGNLLEEVYLLRFTTVATIFIDSDEDGMPDDWEKEHGLDPYDPNDREFDNDNDGLNNLGEYLQGTDPNDSDTDDDGMPDGWEVRYKLNPRVNDADLDPDGDGYSNLEEYLGDSDPNNPMSIPKEEEADGADYRLAIVAVVIIIVLVLLVLFMLMRRTSMEEEELAKEMEEEEGKFKGSKVKEDIFVKDDECPECGADLGDEATACPDCGAEFAWEEYDEDDEWEEEEEYDEVDGDEYEDIWEE